MRTIPVLNGLIAVLISGAGLAALIVLCNTLFPGVITRARQNVERMPARSFLIGLINIVFFGLVAFALMSQQRALRGVGILIATLVLALVVLGLASVARLAGERLLPRETPTPRQWLAGALALELGALTPLVGWILVPLFAGLSGSGAILLALIWRK